MTETHSVKEVWQELAAKTGSGTWERRLHADLPLYLTVTNPGSLPGIVLRARATAAFPSRELKGSQTYGIQVDHGERSTEVTIRTLTSDGTDIFLTFADDLVDHVARQSGDEAAAVALVRRFNRWQQALQRRSDSALSEPRQLGLAGELLTLTDLLIPVLGPVRAVESWTGPERAPQDFQTDRLAVEVKTIRHAEPQTFVIDGERQLDDHGLDLLILTHHRMTRVHGSGTTLPEFVAAARGGVRDSPSAADMLEDRLLDAGYLDSHAADHYSDYGYTLKLTTYYRVRPGFPRLTESDLRPGMGDVRYSVTAAACSDFEVDAETIRGWLADPVSSVDPTTEEESVDVEYKQTAWTPVRETQNEDQTKATVRELQTGIVKSVVAFMNTRGGELIIGVADDKTPTGIEADLISRGREADDTDWYQRTILQLLLNQIDELVYRQVRLSFERYDTATVCHLAVTPSPTPRFGRALPRQGDKEVPTFWVRAGNTTRALAGTDMVNYITQQWT